MENTEANDCIRRTEDDIRSRFPDAKLAFRGKVYELIAPELIASIIVQVDSEEYFASITDYCETLEDSLRAGFDDAQFRKPYFLSIHVREFTEP